MRYIFLVIKNCRKDYLYIILLLVFFIPIGSCKKDKEIKPEIDCNNPKSICQQIVGTWYDNCHNSLTYHEFGPDGVYSSAPTNMSMGATYFVSGNVLTINAYKSSSKKIVTEISPDSIMFSDGTKWCKCSLITSGSIEGIVDGQPYSFSSSYKGENFYDSGKQTLQLLKSPSGQVGWKIIINSLALNSISFPYQVPSNDFNIYFRSIEPNNISNYGYESVSLSSRQGCALQIISMNNNICEGSFSGEIFNNSTDTLYITDGKFKVEYQ